MRLLSQRDPLWSARKLGASELTLGRWGCTTTSISMLSDYFGCYTSPLQLASDVNHYTKDGLVLWQNFKFSKMKFVWREYTRNDAKIKDAIKDPNQAVMFQVNNGQHWVVAIRKTLLGNSYIVADPWDATKCDVLKKYHNITGAAYWQRV